MHYIHTSTGNKRLGLNCRVHKLEEIDDQLCKNGQKVSYYMGQHQYTGVPSMDGMCDSTSTVQIEHKLM